MRDGDLELGLFEGNLVDPLRELEREFLLSGHLGGVWSEGRVFFLHHF